MTKEIDVSDVPDMCEYDVGTCCRVPGHVIGDTLECTACGTVRTAIEISNLARSLHLDEMARQRGR